MSLADAGIFGADVAAKSRTLLLNTVAGVVVRRNFGRPGDIGKYIAKICTEND